MPSEDDDGLIESLKDDAQDIAGASAGALVGFSIGGPVGAVLGSVAPVIVDAAQRLVGRKRKKVAALTAYSIAKIQDALDNGKQVRDDSFFNFEESEPSSAFQLWEGAIEAAETENEQKKLKYIGNLIANISFEPSIGRAQSIELLKIARQLSYSQYCLLSIFADTTVKQQLKDGDYRGAQGNYSFDKISVLTEVLGLYNLGIIVMPGDTMLGISDVNPRKIDLQGIGKSAYTTMELGAVPQEDKVDLINNLSN